MTKKKTMRAGVRRATRKDNPTVSYVVDYTGLCPDCQGHGFTLTRGLPGDAWPEDCRTCDGTGKPRT